ncbi:MAG: pitrilysin family protein [Planctomycetota bacterium]
MVASGFSFEVSNPAPGVTFHINENAKRKTNRLHVYWIGDLDESTVTKRALLPTLLTRGTRSYPTMQSMTQREEWLYGTSVSTSVVKVGERHMISVRSEFVNDNYLPQGESVLTDVVSFLRELMHEPQLEGGAFPTDVLEQEKLNQRRLIESLINDKRSYAHERCVQAMCSDEACRIYEEGRVADLDAITSQDLLSLLDECHKSAPMHVYFSGDLDASTAAAALQPLVGERATNTLGLRAPGADRTPQGVRRVEEEMHVQQANLVMGFRSHLRFADDASIAQAVGNALFGVFPHSKLFVNVREKAALCYTVGSQLDRSNGTLFVHAGIDAGNAGQAVSLIEEQLAEMQAGNFTDADLDATKVTLDNRLLMLEDNPAGLMGVDLAWRLNGSEYDHAAYRDQIRNVSREAVVEAMRRVELDTVFLLKPTQ